MAVTEEVLHRQAQGDLNNHIYSAQATFAQILLVIRRIMSGNQFVSALGTNFYLHYPPSNFGDCNNSLRSSSTSSKFRLSATEEVKSFRNMIISEFPPDIKPLNTSIPTRFDGNTLDLINQAFLETSVISDNRYGLYYQQCAPLSCSYTIFKRRSIIVAILLLVSVCSGLNQGLRLVVPLIGKLVLVIIGKWRNRETVRGECIVQK
ncbi:unnamed protein product [Rotaria sp. Silwood1]|nr:unnamed protein product [Rotaria sp. Silwood1]